MIGHAYGQSIMLQLGSFQFGINTAAYQDLTKKNGYAWASQDRFGQEPNLQYTGPETADINLSGVIFTEYRGGMEQPNKMRALGADGKPLALVDGQGKMMGKWVIISVEEKQSVFASKGLPRKQEFTVQLKKFPDAPPGAANLIGAAASAASTAVGATSPATLAGTKSEFGKMLDKAAAATAGAVASMTSALAAVQAKAAEIGNAVGPVIAKVSQGISTAKALQAAVVNAKGSLGGLTSLAGIQSAAFSVMGAASAASNAGSFAADAAKMLGFDMPTAELSSVVKDCQASCGRFAVSATQAYSSASQIVQLAKVATLK